MSTTIITKFFTLTKRHATLIVISFTLMLLATVAQKGETQKSIKISLN